MTHSKLTAANHGWRKTWSSGAMIEGQALPKRPKVMATNINKHIKQYYSNQSKPVFSMRVFGVRSRVMMAINGPTIRGRNGAILSPELSIWFIQVSSLPILNQTNLHRDFTNSPSSIVADRREGRIQVSSEEWNKLFLKWFFQKMINKKQHESKPM